MMANILHDATIWVAFSFVIFCVGVFFLARGKVVALLDGRIADIRKDIETAAALREEAEGLLAQYIQKQNEAAEEARIIIQNAQRHSDEIRKQAEADLQVSAERHEHQLRDRLRRMEESAMQEIRAHAAALAVKATAEIIAERMDDQTQARLADDSIKQVAGQFN